MAEDTGGVSRIGRYEARRVLGTGGFATVWLGYDAVLDAEVAIKVLAENWSRNSDVRQRFLHEAWILWRLDSDRTIRIYTVEEPPGGQPYFVMEYADRGNLEDRMEQRAAARQPFGIDESVAVSTAIGQGLMAAHAQGIVHRDLKPGNVLFRSAPGGERTLLADFGLARSLESVGATTIAAGTPHYMAPEQSEGRVSVASDVYSAAVILYAMLAGAVPFPYPSVGQVLVAKLTQDPPDIRAIRSDVPPALAAVIMRGLQRDPARRHASALEWLDSLTNAVSGGGTPGVVGGPAAPDPTLGLTLGPEELRAMTGGTPVVGPPSGSGGTAGAEGVGSVAAAPGWPAGGSGAPGSPGSSGWPAGPPGAPGSPSGPPEPPMPPGGPPGPSPSPPPSGPSASARRKRRQRLIAAAAALVLLAGVVAISLASAGTSQAAQVFRTPVGDPGRNPFSAPTVHPTTSATASATPTSAGTGSGLGAALGAFLHVAESSLTAPPGAPANSQPSFSGATPGLYGGTQQLTVCDAKQLVSFLAANPGKARAWASVEGIAVDDIASYVAGLTDVILRTDTQVINHGFVNGQPSTIPEVLEAGTAVLIDKFGVPRARCFCGNPLLPPVPLKSKVRFTGPTWEGFAPSLVTAIQAGSELTKIVLVDVTTGVPFLRPVGTDGSADTPAPPDALANSPFSTSASVGTSTTTAPATTTTTPRATTPPTTQAPAVNVASRGSATASSDTGGLYPASLAIDGDPTSSWFSSGSNADGPVTTYTWTGAQNFRISSISIIGNEANKIAAFRNGFGYANSEIQVFDSSGNLTYDQKFAGPGPASTDVHAIVNATGQKVKVLLSGGQAADCGGFAELQIMGTPA